jgi:hypothetical protein
VYALYGPQVDSESKLPLFNEAAWKKANHVLAGILAGYAADPPGVQFCYQSLNAKGEPAFDGQGIPLLDCNRGTNDVENTHKQIVTTFGTWVTGAEMAECLRAVRRHRYNQKVSEHRRWDFPVLGHFDTWLIDVLLHLAEQNQNVHYLPNWTNTEGCAGTPETFGTAPIHSAELGAALEGLVIPPGASAKFSSEQRFLCERMGTRAPMLPVHGEAECREFDEILRRGNSDQNRNKMAVDWCQHVDGVTIFPRPPVYLRTRHTAWARNQE